MKNNKWRNRIEHYLNKNYFTSKQLYFYNLKEEYLKKDWKNVIMVYTNGKVGSATLRKSLDTNPNNFSLHIHHLNPNYLDSYEKFVKKNYFYHNFPNFYWTSLLWRPLFVKKHLLGKRDLKFITLWREPVSRNISNFFQWIKFSEHQDYYHFTSHQYEMEFDIKTPKDDLSELIDHFLANFPHKKSQMWIKSEQDYILKDSYLNYDFDFNKQYQIIKKENIQFLTLKLEYINQNIYEPILSEYCNQDSFEFHLANETKDKDKYTPYKLFLNQVRFEDKLLDDQYNSNFIKHFYSKGEIETFRDKWKNNLKTFL